MDQNCKKNKSSQFINIIKILPAKWKEQFKTSEEEAKQEMGDDQMRENNMMMTIKGIDQLITAWGVSVRTPWPTALQKDPSISEVNCQNMMPVFQPLQAQLSVMALLRSAADIHPLLPSAVVAGLPSTILLAGTPAAIISLMELPGHHPPEELNRPWAVSQMPTPWLQNCTLQKSIIEPTCWSTVMQPPIGYSALPEKQGAWGAWVMMYPGASLSRLYLSLVVRVISQFSPRESFLWKEGVSSQSMSTPSKLLSYTNWASLLAQSTGSTPAEVGVWVEPKALTKSLTPELLKFFLRVFWIPWLVVPQSLGPMLEAIFAHIPAASTALPGQVQKARATQLQGRGVLVKPGTPSAAGTVRLPHHEVSRLMQMSLMGTVELATPLTLEQLMRQMVTGNVTCTSSRRQRTARRVFTIINTIK